MRVKNVVKVMNFHSLLRVDKARREAEKYFEVETELRNMIDSLTNNRNIILDKAILRAPKDKPALNVFIGSDLGFCGSYNYVINSSIKKDDSEKIIIGKKINKNVDNVKLAITKDEYTQNPKVVSDLIQNGIKNNMYSEINVFYNNYENITNINWLKKRIYPFELSDAKRVNYTEDYVSENDIGELILSMICTYVDYELQILIKNSFASENVMRQNSTNESLKKIEEIEEENVQTERKNKMMIASAKNIERYVKRRSRKMMESGS